MKDATARRWSRFHTALFRWSRGRVGKRLVRNDMLLLTTRGRRTKRRHTVPLLYLRAEGSFVIVASWGGRDYHPDWYANLLHEPDSRVQIRDVTLEVRARMLQGSERDHWWTQAVEAYSGYAEYQQRTSRSIPIVVLDPATR